MCKLFKNLSLSALNSSTTPSGSHTSLISWLNKAALVEIEFPSGTVKVVFYNEILLVNIIE